MANKFTKQGVRDLNHLKGKSVGKKLPMPPAHQMCKHPYSFRHEDQMSGIITCWGCGEVIYDPYYG